MNFFIKIVTLLCCVFCYQFPVEGAVLQGSLIGTPTGVKSVNELKVGDVVLGYNEITHNQEESCVTAISTRETNQFYLITLPDDVICVASDQSLYDPIAQEWVLAKNLALGNFLLNAKAEPLPCLQVILCESKNSLLTIYDISTKAPHTFLSTESQVLTHNIVPVAFGLSFVFGETIASVMFSGISLTVGWLVGTFNSDGKSSLKVDPFKNCDDFANFNDDLDRVNQNKQDHIKAPKHKWVNLVPDPNNNWDKIKNIIRIVLATGVHRQNNNSDSVYRASASISGYVVEVTYTFEKGIRRISNAWIK